MISTRPGLILQFMVNKLLRCDILAFGSAVMRPQARHPQTGALAGLTCLSAAEAVTAPHGQNSLVGHPFVP